MAGGLRYATGREMPPGMQERFALSRVAELRRILRETCRYDGSGNRYFITKWVPLPDTQVIQEFNGSGVIVVDRTGKKWKDGKPWEE